MSELDKIIAEIDRLHERAAHGPWEIEGVFSYTPHVDEKDGNSPKIWSTPLLAAIDLDKDPGSLTKAEVATPGEAMRWDDATFIVALRNAWPAIREALSASAKERQ